MIFGKDNPMVGSSRLLRARSERICRRRAAEQRDELAPVAVGTPITGRKSIRLRNP
jgi:hypothetical protein